MSGIKCRSYVCIICLVFFAVQLVCAQSGRKPRTYPKDPAVTSTEANEEKNSVEAQKDKDTQEVQSSKTTILVATSFQQDASFIYPYPENMGKWFSKRLMQSKFLNVSLIGNQMNRSEAIKRAKSETENLTVWLELYNGGFSAPPSQIKNGSQSMNMQIAYYVYLPVSGKAKYSGTVYLDPTLSSKTINNKVGIPCYPGVYGNDLWLLRGSLEAADRIMSNLNVTAPPVCSSNL